MQSYTTQLALFPESGYWRVVRDGDPQAFAIYQRHYSYYQYADRRRERYGYRNRRLMVGPGEKIVLLGTDGQALCCWRRFRDASSNSDRRVYCTVFRNESPRVASTILIEAMAHAWRRWPGERLWTYVNPAKIASEVPGYCFRRARWRHVSTTPAGLFVFAINPKPPI